MGLVNLINSIVSNPIKSAAVFSAISTKGDLLDKYYNGTLGIVGHYIELYKISTEYGFTGVANEFFESISQSPLSTTALAAGLTYGTHLLTEKFLLPYLYTNKSAIFDKIKDLKSTHLDDISSKIKSSKSKIELNNGNGNVGFILSTLFSTSLVFGYLLHTGEIKSKYTGKFEIVDSITNLGKKGHDMLFEPTSFSLDLSKYSKNEKLLPKKEDSINEKPSIKKEEKKKKSKTKIRNLCETDIGYFNKHYEECIKN